MLLKGTMLDSMVNVLLSTLATVIVLGMPKAIHSILKVLQSVVHAYIEASRSLRPCTAIHLKGAEVDIYAGTRRSKARQHER